MEDKSLAVVEAAWKNKVKIKEQFAPTLTQAEFDFFCSLGAGLGANPFTREIWAVKYKASEPAAVFLGRDFFRRKAQEQDDYDGHVVEAVYAEDNFQVENGTCTHNWGVKARGALVGAYCIVYRKEITHPTFVYAPLDEYDKGFSNWKNMKTTMIKKVAEAQALKMAYQGLFQGAYSEAEADIITLNNEDEPKGEPETGSGEVIQSTDAVVCVTENQVKQIIKQLEFKGLDETYITEQFDIKTLYDLPKSMINNALNLIKEYEIEKVNP